MTILYINEAVVNQMKIIVIEGPDNTGKSTLINYLMSKYKHTLYIHCNKPNETDPIKAALSQRDYFQSIVDNIIWYEHNYVGIGTFIDAVILDRSWIGEYVYGCKYRGNGEEFTKEMIEALSSKLSRSLGNIVRYILLTVDDPKFLVRNDDGKSISKAKLENIQDEIKRFDDIFECVSQYTHKSYSLRYIVNDGLEFKPKEKLFNTIDLIC